MQFLFGADRDLLDAAVDLGILSKAEAQAAIAWSIEGVPSRARSNPPHVAFNGRRFGGGPEVTARVLEMDRQALATAVSNRHTSIDEGRIALLYEAFVETAALLERQLRVDGKHASTKQPLPESVSAALERMRKLFSIAADLRYTAARPEQNSARAINADDACLCLAWSNLVGLSNLDDIDSIRAQLDQIDHYRQCLVLSARTAELVAQNYYRVLGLSVEDISLQQLANDKDEWKSFDLRVGGRFIDVKNARRSFAGGAGHYVEHCVPRFKKERKSGNDVIVTGVVSEYRSDPLTYLASSQSATILGEVTVEDVRNLYRWARRRFGPLLDLKGLWDPGFLPGWIFEYPLEHQPRRADARELIAPLIADLLERGATTDQLPGWLIILGSVDNAIVDRLSDARKRRLTNDLHQMSRQFGLTRRSLVVYSMGLTIEALASGLSPSDDLAALTSVVVMPGPAGEADSIVGLDDPFHFVLQMINAFEETGRTALELGLKLTGFRLTHPAILKGTLADGSIMTLLAYCGGWQRYPIRARCGTIPLSIATDRTCEACARLVCRNCGHCSDDCRLCDTRQQSHADLKFLADEQSREAGGN